MLYGQFCYKKYLYCKFQAVLLTTVVLNHIASCTWKCKLQYNLSRKLYSCITNSLASWITICKLSCKLSSCQAVVRDEENRCKMAGICQENMMNKMGFPKTSLVRKCFSWQGQRIRWNGVKNGVENDEIWLLKYCWKYYLLPFLSS